MKEEKGCTVAVMYKSKYIEKSLHVLQSEQFTKLRHDPTKSIENKMQRELSKLKTRLTMQGDHQFYPTGSNLGTCYGTPKLDKLLTYHTTEELPIRAIVSSIRNRDAV